MLKIKIRPKKRKRSLLKLSFRELSSNYKTETELPRKRLNNSRSSQSSSNHLIMLNSEQVSLLPSEEVQPDIPRLSPRLLETSKL